MVTRIIEKINAVLSTACMILVIFTSGTASHYFKTYDTLKAAEKQNIEIMEIKGLLDLTPVKAMKPYKR